MTIPAVFRMTAVTAAGNRTRLEADSPATAALDHAIDYQYDAMERTVAVTSGGAKTSYEYDVTCPWCGGSKSNPKRIVYPNGIEAEYEWEGGYRLRLLRNRRIRDKVSLSFFEYVYDNVDNRISIRDANGTHKYEYDKLYRLTKQDAGNYNDHVYTYDAAGNRLTWDEEGHPSRAYEYFPGNTLKTVNLSDGSKVEYSWDLAGNLLYKDEFPVSGPSTQTSYTFDAENRLNQVILTSGSTFVYGYDTSGQRVYRNLDGEITWFVFDGLSTVMELDGTKNPTATFVPGISRTRLDLPEPHPEYYLHDGLGSVAQITDHIGNLIQEYRYNPFGDLQNGVTDKLNKYRFVGLAHEDSLSLIYMNARWYEPQTGRFISRDPLPASYISTQVMNAYAYASNNPLNIKDITGKGWWDDLTKYVSEKAENIGEAISDFVDYIKSEDDWIGTIFGGSDKKNAPQYPVDPGRPLLPSPNPNPQHITEDPIKVLQDCVKAYGGNYVAVQKCFDDAMRKRGHRTFGEEYVHQ